MKKEDIQKIAYDLSLTAFIYRTALYYNTGNVVIGFFGKIDAALNSNNKWNFTVNNADEKEDIIFNGEELEKIEVTKNPLL
ncbi:MAG TPA: hypothetical protein PKK70_03560 [Candidatus Paceibacterota bacterium]|nr:hypothetical protein [Candidatus Paceibacterota bacterium]